MRDDRRLYFFLEIWIAIFPFNEKVFVKKPYNLKSPDAYFMCFSHGEKMRQTRDEQVWLEEYSIMQTTPPQGLNATTYFWTFDFSVWPFRLE